MDVLKKELERKRKQIEETKLISEKKFFRRGDLESIQREEYWKKYNEKHALKSPAASISLLDPRNFSETKVESESDNNLNIPFSRDEMIRKLRDRNIPIRLFGESDLDVFRRLRMLEVDLPDVETGFRNDLQAAMDQVDDEYLNELTQGSSKHSQHDVVVGDDTLTLNDIKEEIEKYLGKGDCNKDCELLLQFFNFVLGKWGQELNARQENDKRSSKGKLASATHTQTQEYLKPLFKKLKNKNCQNDIREHLVNMTICLLKRDYIQANNFYMEMAIGNAPWPVGVTASGIHKRPGNEKLYVRNVAHVLNDETQRKYIQGIKRLMTKCQVYFTANPSRCVEYRGIGGD